MYLYLISIIFNVFTLGTNPQKQGEKLQSREMKDGWIKNDVGWMKDEWRMMKDEGWMMKDDDFKLWGVLRTNEQSDRWTNGH